MNTLRKARTWLLYLIGISLLLALFCYGCLLVINREDSPESALAFGMRTTFMQQQRLPDDDNGYAYGLGFSAAADSDAGKVGAARMQWLRSESEKTEFNPENDPEPCHNCLIISDTPLTAACKRPDTSCLLALTRSGTDHQLPHHEKILLQRYLTLLQKRGWQDPMPLDVMTPLPSLHYMLKGQLLLGIKAWDLAGTGHIAEARHLLENDARFWRMALQDSEIIISKIMACVALEKNLQWTALIARRLPARQAPEIIPEPWLSPLTASDTSVSRVLQGEWMFADRVIKSMKSEDMKTVFGNEDTDISLLQKLKLLILVPFIQAQYTSNQQADFIHQLSLTLDNPGTRPGDRISRAKAIEEASMQEKNKLKPYNLGMILKDNRSAEFHHYAARFYDLEGMRYGMLTTIKLRRQTPATEDLPARLKAELSKSLYKEGQYRWAPEKDSIIFSGLAGRENEFAF